MFSSPKLCLHTPEKIKMLRHVFIFMLFAYMILVIDNPYQSYQEAISRSVSSKVWCTSKWGMKTCRFQNLYYNCKYGFLFMLANDSNVSGLDSYRDFTNLKLSPVSEHSIVNMRLTMVQNVNVLGEHIQIVKGNYFMIYRFKPDNFMHVIHDDIIPLYTTFKEICLGNITHCSHKYHLIFVDPNRGSSFVHWYRALSSKEPLSIGEFTEFTFCFSSVTLGIANTSFFQYGFKKPQGPVKTKLVGSDIQDFRNYFLRYFGIEIPLPKACCAATLISRSINRKIINEDYVFQAISYAMRDSFKTRKLVSFTVDMMHNTTEDILNAIVSTGILVAVHGAETILSLFLPDQAIFIEVFPFGIVRENVSPIFSLSTIPAVHFNYLSWTNLKEENSVFHPEYPSQFGGTNGLPEDIIRSIYGTKNVPAVECCNNPYYLFRMYQDTVLDESFQHVASSAVDILRTPKPETDITTEWFFPGPVDNLNCIFYPNLIFATWMVPFNLINPTAVYNVSVLGGSNHYNILTQKTELYLKFSGKNIEKVEVWVSCQVNQRKSVDSYCQCEMYNL